MINISPAFRVSCGMVLIIISLLLIGNLLGLIPDQTSVITETRKVVAESLAAQYTLALRDNNPEAIQKSMETIVKLQPDIVSLGMRNAENRYLARTREHSHLWTPPPGKSSTSTHWQIPIFQGNRQGGTLEVSFTEPNLLQRLSLVGKDFHPSRFALLIAFFALAGFISFFIFMKRVLVHLDPSRVMPARVKHALDTLTEGVLLIDANGRIVLANSSFAHIMDRDPEALIGLKASDLGWLDEETLRPTPATPWVRAMAEGETVFGVVLCIVKKQGTLTFSTNGTPIIDGKGRCRGAIASFDDITEQEKQKNKLSEMLIDLRKSQEKIQHQKEELEILATQDPLTGCLNRRAFFAASENYFGATADWDGELSCIMADIDLFKSINDRYGHSVGDEAIRSFANTIISVFKDTASAKICRYGGEEFCVLLPGCDLDQAAALAEQIRGKCGKDGNRALPDIPDLVIAGSFGVSSLKFGAKTVEALIGQADTALYAAKQQGRNRVICWDESRKNELCAQNSAF